MTALGFFCPVVALDGGNEPAGGVPVFFAVATGEVGDPRSFKRPVRVTVPQMMAMFRFFVSAARAARRRSV